MATLKERMLNSGSVKYSATLSESKLFVNKDFITTNLPILNIGLSGDIIGGLTSGITIMSGHSKSFKTLLALYCLKAYMDKYPDAICLFYDSEFGAPPAYFKWLKLDTTRIIHIPIMHVEELKFDMVKRLNELKRGDKVFVFLDSLGALPSKKEVDDANDEKSVADMTRAKAIRSFFRLVTPQFTMLDIPFVVINHVYKTLEMYAKTVIPGGEQVTLAANTIFVITKEQIKNTKNEITGWIYTIHIEKSRFVKEKVKFKFTVDYNGGISKYSGLFDLAKEAGYFVPGPTKGSYLHVDLETGEVGTEKFKEIHAVTKEFWTPILEDERFQDFITSKYKLSETPMTEEDNYQVPVEEEETEE